MRPARSPRHPREQPEHRPLADRLPLIVSVVCSIGLIVGAAAQLGVIGDDGFDLSALDGADPLSQPVLPPASERDFPQPGVDEEREPLAEAPVVSAPDDGYAFLDTAAGDDGADVPVRWSPCRPIHVVVNETNAPPGFIDIVSAELETLSGHTGLVFVVDGATTETPSTVRSAFLPDLYGDRWAPVLVGVASSATVADLDGDVAGVASSVTAIDPSSGATVRVTGWVALDRDILGAEQPDGTPAYRAVLRHELGHLVGLDHVDDPGQLMFESAVQSTYQAGDLTGLAQLGGGPCAPGV